METFAVAHSTSFRSIYNGNPFRTFPYRDWCVPPSSSVLPSKFKSCFSCVSASGYCCTNVWYYDFNVERLFIQNIWYPSTGTSPILDTTLTSHFAPRVPNVFIDQGAEYVVVTSVIFTTLMSSPEIYQ
jgi:hypothetical protein